MNLEEAAKHLRALAGGDLTERIAGLEAAFSDRPKESLASLCVASGVTDTALEAALVLKATAGQINVLIHTIGILAALPHILNDGERVASLSLGAGNTGRKYDLETDQRVAEFKFIQWRGGPESIRQNGLFKDFFYLAEDDTPKERYLYLVGLEHPIKFFNGRRALSSVLTKDHRLRSNFQRLYGDRFQVVREYYEHRRDRVHLRDVSTYLPAFLSIAVDAEQEGGEASPE
jgi:hypothetical protein